jgi:hypothetical protein
VAAANLETVRNVRTQLAKSPPDQGLAAMDVPLRRISSCPFVYSTIEKLREESISATKIVFQAGGAAELLTIALIPLL